MLSPTELGRFLRLLPSRLPRRIHAFVRGALRGKPHGYPPDEFDQRTGLDTAGTIPRYKLDSINGNYIHGQGYTPVYPDAFREAIALIPDDLSTYSFIDLGCGKGRALFLASEFPFKRIVGVELSPMLVGVANANLSKWPQDNRFVVECGDASEVRFPTGDIVVFLYNPFGPTILKAVLRNLRAQSLTGIAKLWIIYFSDVHAAVFDSQDWLAPYHRVSPTTVYTRAFEQNGCDALKARTSMGDTATP